MGILNIKEIEMPEFAEDDRVSSWAPQAENTLCWGEGRLPWQGKAEEKHTPKMSQGPTLFSCGVMENDRWRDLSRKCPLQLEQPGASIWDCLSDKGEEGSRWPRDTAGTCSVTNLIKELSLSDPHGHPSAPPSKRQCRSLSFSDEMSGFANTEHNLPLPSAAQSQITDLKRKSGRTLLFGPLPAGPMTGHQQETEQEAALKDNLSLPRS
ncbi:hypothetical protein EK904_004152 [Melospiza melodia maxima]|nr:hypothetical protein EK904_004152 [Melospiza melodia maxima]